MMAESTSLDETSEKPVVAEIDTASSNKDQPSSEVPQLRVDKHGLPCVPQPSHWRDDPLNWPSWLKWAVLIQVSYAAFLGPYNCAVVNPSLVLLAKAFHVNAVTAAYNSTTAIIFGGVFGFVWPPLTNVYGRRPALLVSQLLTIAGGIGSAKATTFSTLLGTRVLTGIGISCMMSVGPACINDMFYFHERGFKTGVFTIFLTNGAHVAVLFGGFVAQAVGWQWDYWVPVICTAASFVLALFFLPETLFSRHPEFLSSQRKERTYVQMLFDFKGNLIPGRKVQTTSFLHPFMMLKYPSVAFPALYYFFCWTFINTLPAITIANTYNAVYHFQSGQAGLCLGISLIIGSVLAELSTGRVTDLILYLDAKKNDGVRRPEARLYLTAVAAVVQPVGLVVYGFCIQTGKGWFPPLVGLAIGAFGIQMASTCLYAYVSDCYKPQTMEISCQFNLGRGLAFVVGYFGIPFALKVGYGWAWFTFAMLMVLAYIPLCILIFKGEKWRNKLGLPTFDRYI